MKKSSASLLVLILVFLSSLSFGKLSFSICMVLFACIALREMLSIRGKDGKIPIEIELLSYVLLGFFVMNNFNSNYDLYLLDYRLLSALMLIDFIPLIFINDKKKYSLTDALFLIGCTLFIGITFNLITQFRAFSINYVLYIFFIAFFTDCFSYVTGTLIGRRKFMNSISEKKTLEGAIGGFIMGTIVPSLFLISVVNVRLPFYVIFMISGCLSILGQIGDLVFSFMKREYSKKDFSNLIVGNGGLLDVTDSIIFITLGFLLFYSFI